MLVCLKEMRTEAIYLRFLLHYGSEVIEDLTIIGSSVFPSVLGFGAGSVPYCFKVWKHLHVLLLFSKYICIIVLEMQHLFFCLSDGWKLENMVLVFIFAVFEC